MSGTTKLWDVGMQLEYYFNNLEDYGLLFNDDHQFAPYISAGIHYSHYTPTFKTTWGGGDYISNPTILPDPWQDVSNSIFLEPDNVFSFTASAGTRYNISEDFDVFIDARWQYFFSDKIEGLDAPHDLSGSKFNDTLIYLGVGIVYDISGALSRSW